MSTVYEAGAKTATKKDPVAEYVKCEFERYQKFHQEHFDDMEEVYDDWKCTPPMPTEDWHNAVHVPVTFEAEQTISPRLYAALFPVDAPIEVVVEGDAPEEDGIRIKGIIQHYFRVTDMQSQVQCPLSQTTLFGTGYVESGSWFVKRGWVTSKSGVRYNTIIDNRPDFRAVDFFEIFPHPAKMEMEDGLPLIRRRYVDAEFLKRLKDNPNFKIEKISEAIESENPLKSELGQAYQAKSGEEYELLEYWGPWDEEYKDEGDKDQVRMAVPYWISVINRSVTIRDIPNPYDHQIPPFCKMKLYDDTKPGWFGVGIGKIGKPTQERLNKIVNQRLNNVDLVLNKQGCYNGNDPLVNVKKLQVSKPGQFHKVSDTVASIRWIDTPDVTMSSYKEEELAKQDYREATGATAHLMPEAGSEHRTAMGIQLLQGAAGMRFRPILRKLESSLIQQTAMFFFSNLKQFMTTAQWVQITGKQGDKPILIRPEEIQSKVYFIPTGVSETMNKETQVQQLLRFKELTANDPTVNRQEINKRIGELMGFKNMKDLLTVQMATMPSEGPLDLKTQQFIQQRLQEGATPDQIKEELLGAKPQGMNLTEGAGGEGQSESFGPPEEPAASAPRGPQMPMMGGMGQ